MAQVFISYSRKDQPFVEQLAADLKNAGLVVWYDVSNLGGGSRWRIEIESAIRNSQFVVAVLSPDSIASEWVEREFLFASNLKRKIIPLMYRSCELPLNYLNLNYIDVQGKNYIQNFNELLKALSVDAAATTLPSSKIKKPSFKLKTEYVVAIIGVIIVAVLLGSSRIGKMFAPMPTTIATIGVTQVVTLTFTSLPLSATPEPSLTPTETTMPTATPLPTEITDASGVQMVLVPAGAFTMGSDLQGREKPVHSVYLDAFYIDKFEVTNAQYKMCDLNGPCASPNKTGSDTRSSYYGNPQYVDYPVIWVDWNMAKSYCDWRESGARLPIEAEWEKAARGTEERIYPWGDGISCEYANYVGCKGDTASVGSYSSGKSIYGIYDMAGNVWEWVSDWYDETYYGSAGAVTNNPQGPSGGSLHVLRGGSWLNGEQSLRTTMRYRGTSIYNTSAVGFRCVRPIP